MSCALKVACVREPLSVFNINVTRCWYEPGQSRRAAEASHSALALWESRRVAVLVYSENSYSICACKCNLHSRLNILYMSLQPPLLFQGSFLTKKHFSFPVWSLQVNVVTFSKASFSFFPWANSFNEQNSLISTHLCPGFSLPGSALVPTTAMLHLNVYLHGMSISTFNPVFNITSRNVTTTKSVLRQATDKKWNFDMLDDYRYYQYYESEYFHISMLTKINIISKWIKPGELWTW